MTWSVPSSRPPPMPVTHSNGSPAKRLQVAYLILAHNHPLQVARLVDRLRHPGARIYIHVDAKADLRPFLDVLREKDVVLLRDRVSVFWGGYSVVEATLALMRTALRDGFGYAVLLSGSDYPIKPAGHIHDFLATTPFEHINYWRMEDRPSWWYRLQYYFYLDSYLSNPRTGPAPTQLLASSYHALVRSRAAGWILPKRTLPVGLVPYAGSQWWMLSYACIAHILDRIDSDPDLVTFYRFTYVPDEMIFQTIVLNSPFAERVVHRDQYLRWRQTREVQQEHEVQQERDVRPARGEPPMLPESSFHGKFMYWSPTKGRPATLDEEDFSTLQRSDALFARKFDPQRSAGLLARLDNEVLREVSDLAV